MNNTRLTLHLESPHVTELLLQAAKPMQIDLPTSAGQRARAWVDTTEHWSKKTSYVPAKGEIIVYSDRNIIGDIAYPGVKIGDGLAFVVDLPFVGDDIAEQISDALSAHIARTDIHITPSERAYWNNKLDSQMAGENLILAPAIIENGLLDP